MSTRRQAVAPRTQSGVCSLEQARMKEPHCKKECLMPDGWSTSI